MAEAYLALGANLGRPIVQLAEARHRLAAQNSQIADSLLTIMATSALYLTPPFGRTDQPAFVNQCLKIATDLSPHQLLDFCLETERQMGRERTQHWGPRAIDIDVLAYGDVTIADRDLTLPHPGVLQRAFVLVPLVEIAPDLVIAGVKIRDALATLDARGIEKINS